MNYRREQAKQDSSSMWTCMVYEDRENGLPLLEAWGRTKNLAEDAARILTVLWQAARPDFNWEGGPLDGLIKPPMPY